LLISILKLNNLKTLQNQMKKLLLLICLVYSLPSYSQTKIGFKLSIGSTGYKYIDYNDILLTKNGLGLGIGLFANIQSGDNFSLQPAIEFKKQTASVTYKAIPAQQQKELSLTGTEYSVSLPLNMVYKLDKIEIGFGPQFNFIFADSEHFYYKVHSNASINLLVGYRIDEKTSLQANYAHDLGYIYSGKWSALNFSIMRTFGK
jgi:hypothetical protein